MSGFLGSLGGLMQNEDHQQAAGGLLSSAFSSAGGLPGLMSRFQSAGLGDKMQSWVGSGSNLPLAAEEVERVFPPQQIESFAAAHGVPAGVATQMLAHLLPHAVDSQTPGGQTPGGQTPGGQGLGGQMSGDTVPQGAAMAGTDAAPQGAGSGFDFGGLVQRLIGGGR